MSCLNLYALPYTAPEPPAELFRHVERESGHSDTAAFKEGLDNRDVFFAKRKCVICGSRNRILLERCHIVARSDCHVWTFLRNIGWIPEGAREAPGHEPRNGLTMCPNHNRSFERWQFFIRFRPGIQKYIFIHYDSYAESLELAQFHGKAIALDPKDKHSPLPLLFLAHEYMVRGRNFHQPSPIPEPTNTWQDWMVNDDVVNEGDEGSFTFNRSGPPRRNSPTYQSANLQGFDTDASPSGSQNGIMPPTADLVAELMAYQLTMPSWKAWQTESMSWEGTAEENIKQYVEKVGVEEPEG
ncbi:uncharacterized protein EI90DRAFT_3157775 [Cantharellus anzutake]|uniref:uncharacterized protein n=1 Tax=Cantharellus anzutake TaxID=1750568 RepID=UPI001904035A|nr:uncharacterized protein EI90DRAFT_3157775 [Cantharellus anzutake]KAF8322371.1 hypothetical protein EI90DRAFT_3157775 [Cantharellus anzutake]